MTTALPPLKLISHKLCPYVQRSIITLIEKQIPHERAYIDLAHKPDWFLQRSPLGKVPILLVGEEVLFESAVIC
ncbi:MAG TPA: glutathione S-transferase N-terminal domain-containing protein, partial [Trichocoleus sp.]